MALASIARVIVDVALDREFDYAVPEALRGRVRVGSRVAVPFGRRRTEGYVMALLDASPVARLKPIQRLLHDEPMLTPALLKLGRWMADYYCAPLEQAIRALLPGAVRRKGAAEKARLFVEKVSGVGCQVSAGDGGARPPSSRRGGAAARSSLPSERSEVEAERHAEASSGPDIQQPTVPISHVKGSERQANDEFGGSAFAGLSHLGVGHSVLDVGCSIPLSPKQRQVLEALGPGGRFLAELTAELGVTAAPVKALEQKGLVTIESRAMGRDPLAHREILPTQPLALMTEQAEALAGIKRMLDDRRAEVGGRRSEDGGRRAEVRKQHVVLLYGVTGSGKTEVYLQAIDHVLAQGRGAVVLVPEIALTEQTIDRFRSRFSEHVAVLHSHLGDGERHDEWHRIRKGEARIVIGARSAVFAPVHNLGLIVVDEEHEPSYKQDEAPRYHARDVAVMRGKIEGATVVLGSATPSLESWLNTRKGKYALARLPRRADHRRFPVVRVVDLRLKGGKDEKLRVLSHDLCEAIRLRLERAEQTILFLNRRGYSSSLVCPRCGYVAQCESCSVACTYHRHDERLRCHICGAEHKVPEHCPGCKDPAFKYAGIGTQRVEAIVKQCFPHARVQRMDTDITRRKDAYERIFGAFRSGRIDILIGTQMIAKGLHFPNVTLVGVIHADLSLHVPDFRAGERTFQLLAQVAGRAGRGDVAGEVIVQTFTPFQPSVQAARRVDFEGFADQEMAFREELSYPPYARLVCLRVDGASEEQVVFAAETLARQVRALLPDTVLGGEAVAAPLARAKGRYRYQLLLRGPSVHVMGRAIREVLARFKSPGDVRVKVDVDAVSLV